MQIILTEEEYNKLRVVAKENDANVQRMVSERVNTIIGSFQKTLADDLVIHRKQDLGRCLEQRPFVHILDLRKALDHANHIVDGLLKAQTPNNQMNSTSETFRLAACEVRDSAILLVCSLFILSITPVLALATWFVEKGGRASRRIGTR